MSDNLEENLKALLGVIEQQKAIARLLPHDHRGFVDAVETLAYERKLLRYTLEELGVQPDQLGRYGGTDYDWRGWRGKIIEALRTHLKLAPNVDIQRNNESWSDRQKRETREAHEKTAAYAIEVAEWWMAEAKRREAEGR